MGMFKYYKRGKGELDTSNFPDLLEERIITIDVLDEKTFMSLLAFKTWSGLDGSTRHEFTVTIRGYVAHLRGDKDEFPVSELYERYLQGFYFKCLQIQHESTGIISSNTISPLEITEQLSDVHYAAPLFIGADGSVNKFFYHEHAAAIKNRTQGKVVSLDLYLKDLGENKTNRDFIIVDDILGAGATVKLLVDVIRRAGYTNPIHLWVQYNEGIHSDTFLDQFKSSYIGQEI
ncbi:MAG: phosphoribosyltransferase [Alphaproteobacteria bacterium]|nr:phosphoribosyltransferase [Alphaproteobacteria bacterium]